MALGDIIQSIGYSVWGSSASLPSAATVGNTIIVFSNADDAGLTCSDDLNGAYTKIATLSGSVDARISIFSVVNTSNASAPTITTSFGGRRTFAMELEGELTTAAGTGTYANSSLSVGGNAFSTSTNDIPANSVSIAAWGTRTADGNPGITPDSPWTGVSGDNKTYPFFRRQDASAVTGAVFSGTYAGFDGNDAVALFISLVSASASPTYSITDIDGDNSVRAGQDGVVITMSAS